MAWEVSAVKRGRMRQHTREEAPPGRRARRGDPVRGKDILVSAAAGSGKTSVLVERIVRRLLDPERPVDIDRMLVVTFTEARRAK